MKTFPPASTTPYRLPLYFRSMQFTIGQRVRMKRTENYGEVTALLGDELVQVKLDGGMGHMPLPTEALEAATAGPRSPKPNPAPAAPPAKATAPKEVSKADLSADNGLQLAFDTVTDNEANPVAYEVYLLNSTPHKIIYEVKAFTQSNQRWAKAGQLGGYTKKRLETAEYRWLNEKLSLSVDVRTVIANGTGPRNFKKVTVKGKTFFSKLTEVPELYREAHLYPVFPELSTAAAAGSAAPPAPSLRAIARQQAAARPAPREASHVPVQRTNLRAKLDFENSIDLHLPALVADPDSVPADQILTTQMRYFQNYLSMALKLGIDNIFIIHGVGNGVLKRMIHKELDKTKFVREYKNEYHEKYGYGATEVIFD